MQGQYVKSNEVLDKLRKNISDMEVAISEEKARGKEVDPSLSLALSDAQELLTSLTTKPSISTSVFPSSIPGENVPNRGNLENKPTGLLYKLVTLGLVLVLLTAVALTTVNLWYPPLMKLILRK